MSNYMFVNLERDFPGKKIWIDALTHFGDKRLVARTIKEMGSLYQNKETIPWYYIYEDITTCVEDATRGWMWQETCVKRNEIRYRTEAHKLVHEVLVSGARSTKQLLKPSVTTKSESDSLEILIKSLDLEPDADMFWVIWPWMNEFLDSVYGQSEQRNVVSAAAQTALCLGYGPSWYRSPQKLSKWLLCLGDIFQAGNLKAWSRLVEYSTELLMFVFGDILVLAWHIVGLALMTITILLSKSNSAFVSRHQQIDRHQLEQLNKQKRKEYRFLISMKTVIRRGGRKTPRLDAVLKQMESGDWFQQASPEPLDTQKVVLEGPLWNRNFTKLQDLAHACLAVYAGIDTKDAYVVSAWFCRESTGTPIPHRPEVPGLRNPGQVGGSRAPWAVVGKGGVTVYDDDSDPGSLFEWPGGTCFTSDTDAGSFILNAVKLYPKVVKLNPGETMSLQLHSVVVMDKWSRRLRFCESAAFDHHSRTLDGYLLEMKVDLREELKSFNSHSDVVLW